MHSILCPVASEYDSLLAEYRSVGVLRALWIPGLRTTYVDDKVATWRDLVKGYLLEQDDEDARFTVSSTGWNGRRMFTCAGAQYMTCEHADWNTLFGGDDADCALVLVHDLADSTMPLGLYGATASHRIALWFASSTARLIREGTDFSGGAGSQGSGLRHHIVKNVGAVASVYRDRMLMDSGALDAASQTLVRLAVGAMVVDAGGASTFAVGDIGAIAVYSTISDEVGLSAQLARYGYHLQNTVTIAAPGTVYADVPATVTVTTTGAIDRVVLTEVDASEAWDDSSAPFSGDWTPSTSGTRTLHADGYVGEELVATNDLEVEVGTLASYFTEPIGSSGAGVEVWILNTAYGLTVSESAGVSCTGLVNGYALAAAEGERAAYAADNCLGHGGLAAAGASRYTCTAAPFLAEYIGTDPDCEIMAVASSVNSANATLCGFFTGTVKHEISFTYSTQSWTYVRSTTNVATYHSGAGMNAVTIKQSGTTGTMFAHGVARATGERSMSMTPTSFALFCRDYTVPTQYWTGNCGVVIVAPAIADRAELQKRLNRLGYGLAVDEQVTLAYVLGDTQDLGPTMELVGNMLRDQGHVSGVASLMLGVGDNGTPATLASALTGVCDPTGVSETQPVFASAFGNHDTSGEARDAVFAWQAAFRDGHEYWVAPTITAASGTTIGVIALDFMLGDWRDQDAFFTAALAAATEDVIIVLFHERWFSADTWSGSLDDTLPWVRLIQAAVTAGKHVVVFCGHVHMSECSTVLGTVHITAGRTSAPDISDPDPDFADTLELGEDSLAWDAATMCEYTAENDVSGFMRIIESGTDLVVQFLDMQGTAAAGYLPVVAHQKTISIA
jgi:hypothetical protein